MSIALTSSSSHAVTADGNVWNWGNGSRSGIAGQQDATLNVPTGVPGLDAALEISAGPPRNINVITEARRLDVPSR